jgi:hypothetical protein
MGSPAEVRSKRPAIGTPIVLIVCKADPLQQKRRVRMDGNSSANPAQFDSPFKDGDLQPTRPQGERGRQGPAARPLVTMGAILAGLLPLRRHDLPEARDKASTWSLFGRHLLVIKHNSPAKSRAAARG